MIVRRRGIFDQRRASNEDQVCTRYTEDPVIGGRCRRESQRVCGDRVKGTVEEGSGAKKCLMTRHGYAFLGVQAYRVLPVTVIALVEGTAMCLDSGIQL